MINRISKDDLRQKILQLQAHGVPYILEHTNERFVIKTDSRWGDWQSKESRFKTGELHFIKQVKSYILKNKTYTKVRNAFKKEGSTNRVKYNFFSKDLPVGTVIENIWEVDLKNAYWKTAYNLNLFDAAIYEKGIAVVSKKTRLAAIGSLAKRKSRIQFDGVKETQLEPETSTFTEFLWHTIAHRVGRVMAKAARKSKKDFLFLWVDAIFVKSEALAKEIVEDFKAAGYESTLVKCEWIKVTDRNVIVKCTAKPKRVEKIVESFEEINGIKYKRRKKVVTWVDERPFSHKDPAALTLEDVMELSSSQ